MRWDDGTDDGADGGDDVDDDPDDAQRDGASCHRGTVITTVTPEIVLNNIT